MEDKAYIVANKEQELDMLNKFEQKGLVWRSGRRAVDFVPSESVPFDELTSFPYAFIVNGVITWSPMEELKDETIVYDARNEGEEVDTRYKVTQRFMDELIKWRNDNGLETKTGYMYEAVDGDEIQRLPDLVDIWWTNPSNSIERNNRLIAIIQWLNGEDMFKVEAPHQFVVRSKEIYSDGYYSYVKVVDQMALNTDYNLAMKFNTREEAQEWTNSHQVVVEIDAEGNEVE